MHQTAPGSYNHAINPNQTSIKEKDLPVSSITRYSSLQHINNMKVFILLIALAAVCAVEFRPEDLTVEPEFGGEINIFEIIGKLIEIGKQPLRLSS